MRVFRKDDRMSHTKHGVGTVVEANDLYTVISFDTSGVRKFVTRLVRLDASDVSAPRPASPTRKRRSRAAEPVSSTPRRDA